MDSTQAPQAQESTARELSAEDPSGAGEPAVRLWGVATVNERGQVTIPRQLRSRCDIRPHERLLFVSYRPLEGVLLLARLEDLSVLGPEGSALGRQPDACPGPRAGK